MLRARIPIAVLALFTATGLATAQVVVPNVYTTAEAPGLTALPIHIQGQPFTLQLIYDAGQLTNVVGMDITGISYRRGATEGGGYPLTTTTWNPYVIRLGPGVDPSQATGTFANNFTGTPIEVKSTSFTAPPFAWPNNGPPGPNPWGTEIEFDQPYHYTGGDLTMLITHPGSNNPMIGNALMNAAGAATPGRGTDFAYFQSPGFDVGAGTTSNFMPVVRLTVEQPIPEPGGLLAVGAAGLGGLAVRRWRQRRSVATLAA